MIQIELTSKLVLVIIAITVVNGMTASALAAKNPAYTDLTSASVVDVDDPDLRVQYSITTAGNLPLSIDSYIKSKKAFGYGWIGDPHIIGDPQIRDATVVTFDRSAGTTSSWDAHTYTLKEVNDGTKICVTAIGDPQIRTVSIDGNTLTATLNRDDVSVTQDTFDYATAFELKVNKSACKAGTLGLELVGIGDPQI